MDLYCITCGEPHEIDCLHEPEAYGLTVKDSTIVKCSCCERHRKRGFPLKDTASTAAIMHEIMGDDIDAIACAMEDMGF
jgi:hypothetical protein